MKKLFLIIAAVPLIGCEPENKRWNNEKMEAAYTFASELSKAKVSEVIRVDDSYPNGQQVQEGKNLHGYKMISQPISLSKKSRDE